jgi:arginase
MALVLIDAPSNLGLKRPAPDREPGVRYAPWQLRRLGLADRLSAGDGGSVEPPAYEGVRDPATGVLHGNRLAPYAVQLADALAPLLDRGDQPLVLGGDCSVGLGCALAMRRRGRFGWVHLDGHRDLLRPRDTVHGAAAGMALAFATGHGPHLLTRIEGHLPLVDPADVLLFGHRDEDRWYDAALLAVAEGPMRSTPLDEARRGDIDRVFARRLATLLDTGIDALWVHLDADVLDDAAMAAVDARQPEGMTLDELARLLAACAATGRLRGLHLTNYDPERDPGHAAGKRLVDLLATALAPREADDATAGDPVADDPAPLD